ncbi:MAG TPA: hypothetical protein VKT73_12940 [Xanthobacteraceae bacterium]|nr:hypothetical protein [Xanthobacteraceae bacterium]
MSVETLLACAAWNDRAAIRAQQKKDLRSSERHVENARRLRAQADEARDASQD